MKTWLCLAVLVGSCGPAQAGTLLCGTKVISAGVTSGQLLAACGDPTQIDRTSIFRAVTTGASATTLGGALLEVHAEVWLYNFGPGKLMQRLRIEDGMVVQIESLGYGYVNPNE